MFGKGALIMVMGAVIIFSLYQLRLNRSVLSTTDNFNRQFTKTTISAASQSAMNYALNDVLNSGTTSNTYFIYSHNCTTLVKIQSLAGGDSVRTSVVSHGWIIDEYDIEWPVVYSGKGFKDETTVLYGVNNVSSTWLVDRKGILRYYCLKDDELRDAIIELIDE